MIGISWGGFNGLQIAARQPPALKAVISLCSTDDRYSDDIHFMGGALLTDKMTWADTMLSISASPPDPAVVGDRWKEMWLRRLDEQDLWMAEWLRHQRRDAFYRHGSVCENWAAVRIPVYAVGGWIDGYSNAVFRMLQNLPGPTKALVGPWAHKYPHFAKPEPTIDFLQECLRWWDFHLKGQDTGIADEPPLRAWINDSAPPRSHIDVQPGRWVTEPSWPSANVRPLRWTLAPGRLAAQGGTDTMRIRSPQTVGLASGNWCPYGVGHDAPLNQRMEAGGSLVFDSPVLGDTIELLGAPIVGLSVTSDQPQAQLACVLSEVRAGGADTATGIIAPGLPGHREKNLYGHDPEAAKQLLTEAGVTGLTVKLAILNKAENLAAAQVIQANLGDIGVTVEVDPLDSGTFWNAGVEKEGDAWKSLQLFIGRFTMEPDPSFATEWFTPQQIGVWNWERFDSKEFGAIDERAATELDVAKRSADYQHLQDLMEQSGSYVFLTHGAAGVLWKNSITPALRPDGVVILPKFRAA